MFKDNEDVVRDLANKKKSVIVHEIKEKNIKDKSGRDTRVQIREIF